MKPRAACGHPRPWPTNGGKFLHRNRVPVAAVLLLFALVVAFTVTVTLQSRELARERDRAERERVKAQRVSDFMVELFEEVDPSEARGNEITVREVMDRGVGRIQETLGDQPEVQATLLYTIGLVYTNLSLLDEAEPILAQALEKRRALPGDHQLDVADTLSALSNVYAARSEMRKALAISEEELSIRQSISDSNSSEILHIILRRAHIFTFLGELSKARVLTLQADEIIQDTDLPLEEEKSYLIGVLATLESLAGDFEASERLYKSYVPSLSLRMKFNLAVLYRSTGRFQEAEELLFGHLKDMAEIYGHSSLPYFRGLLGLAWTYVLQGHAEQAIPVLQRAERIFDSIALWRSNDPRVRFDLARIYFYRGVVLRLQGKTQDSEDLFHQVIEITSPLVAETEIVWYRSFHTRALLLLGKLDEARPVAEGLLRIGYNESGYQEFCASYGIFPPMSLEQRQQIGPYKILRQLGRGGMGAVYLAPETGRGHH